MVTLESLEAKLWCHDSESSCFLTSVTSKLASELVCDSSFLSSLVRSTAAPPIPFGWLILRVSAFAFLPSFKRRILQPRPRAYRTHFVSGTLENEQLKGRMRRTGAHAAAREDAKQKHALDLAALALMPPGGSSLKALLPRPFASIEAHLFDPSQTISPLSPQLSLQSPLRSSWASEGSRAYI